MAAFHAICSKCGRSIFTEGKDETFYCPYCGEPLTRSGLAAEGNVVNVEQARSDYATAHGYFNAGDYAMACMYFERVCAADRNNFFADYFRRLSDIRRKRQEGKLCGAEFIMDMLTEPVAKMKLTSQPQSVKRGFLLHAFSEAEALLGALYDTIGAIYSKPEDIDRARAEYIAMGRECRRLTMLDRDVALLDDPEVGGHAVSVCEVVIKALQKAVSFISVGDVLSEPSEQICGEAKALYGVFIHFARSVRPGYNVGGCDAVYADNRAYNEIAKKAIAEYTAVNRTDARKQLTTKGKPFDDMIYRCRSAFDYTYNTIFVCPGGRTGGKEEEALITDAFAFAVQLLLPRTTLGIDGYAEVSAMDLASLSEFSRKLNALIGELETINRPLLDAQLEKLYSAVCDCVRYRYNDEEPRMRREIDAARLGKNKQYFHYRNLLYGLVCASAAALTRIVPYTSRRQSERIRLLRAGKQAADGLLYLFGYKLEDIESVPKFASLAEIYGCLNTDLKAMS